MGNVTLAKAQALITAEKAGVYSQEFANIARNYGPEIAQALIEAMGALKFYTQHHQVEAATMHSRCACAHCGLVRAFYGEKR